MFKKIALGILAVLLLTVVVFVAVVAMQADEFHIARSARVNAPPNAAFAYINDLRKWNDWSPWAKLDPNAKNRFSGTESGEGAKFSWSGNDQVGEGTMTIIESKPDELIRMQLDFTKPMQDTSFAQFDLKPDGDATEVTWSMSGKQNFVEKAFCMFMDMDQMLGGQFETGLASLKARLESVPEASATDKSVPQ
jgi:carbon monoxide dehydrogenase subunit G